MALVLNEEQRLLKESAQSFLAAEAPVAALRQLRDIKDALGYDPALWRQMAEMGWASIILPEEYGGLDFGFAGLGVVLEETGRTLTASPLFASAVLGASTLLLGGNAEQKASLLPAIADGSLTLALALEESHHHRPTRIATRAEKQGEQYLINGCKTFVLDGQPVLDRGRVALAAEMLGLSMECFERTVAYLKQREQFGALIGSFQALQHRAAHMQAEIELCRSVLLQALSTVDDTPEQLPMLASLAKAQLNELVKLTSNEAVQMHGGIGVTDELEIGFFLKRARVAMQILGDTGFHKDRYATLSGY